jgi:hypothetical protein
MPVRRIDPALGFDTSEDKPSSERSDGRAADTPVLAKPVKKVDFKALREEVKARYSKTIAYLAK